MINCKEKRTVGKATKGKKVDKIIIDLKILKLKLKKKEKKKKKRKTSQNYKSPT